MSSALSSPSTHPFSDLGLHPGLTDSVAALGFTDPTPIQRQAIPVLLEGHDVLGQAATGTGKTAAFGLPVLQRILFESDAASESRRGAPEALILVPTRELAIQVAKALDSFAKGSGVCTAAIYGGQDMRVQLRALKSRVNIVVATPGRLLDHVSRRSLSLEHTTFVVLDEADEMMDRGFAEDLEAIFERLPAARQTAMFSATLPSRVAHMAQQALVDPHHIKAVAAATRPGAAPQVRHGAFLVPPSNRPAALGRILRHADPEAALVFCRTRADVDTLYQSLSNSGHNCEALHGGMSQDGRDKVMQRFRQKDVNLLIATDVAARGLDIDHVSHVFNYDLPESPAVYVHRCGRTGRAGRSGTAMSFVKPAQRRLLTNIAREAKVTIHQDVVPTAAQMRKLHAERSLQAVRDAVEATPGPNSVSTIEQALRLSEEHTPVQLAAAALSLAAAANGGHDAGLDRGELGSSWGQPVPYDNGRSSKPRHRRSGGPGGRQDYGRRRN